MAGYKVRKNLHVFVIQCTYRENTVIGSEHRCSNTTCPILILHVSDWMQHFAPYVPNCISRQKHNKWIVSWEHLLLDIGSVIQTRSILVHKRHWVVQVYHIAQKTCLKFTYRSVHIRCCLCSCICYSTTQYRFACCSSRYEGTT